MIESISGIISLFNGLKNGLTSSSEFIEKKKRKKIIRKLVILKINLEDIIETAEDIFTCIEKIKQSKRTSKEDLELFEENINIQSHNLHDLLFSFRNPIIEKTLKTFNPELRRNIKKHNDMKRSRIDYFILELHNLSAESIRKRYDEKYLKEGYDLLYELKETSANFTSYINDNATIEDILYK